MLSNLKIIVFCYLCTLLGLSRGFSVVLSPLSGWVLQGSLGGSPFFSVSKGGNAVEFGNYAFRLFWYIFGVLPLLEPSWAILDAPTRRETPRPGPGEGVGGRGKPFPEWEEGKMEEETP